jgi:7-cyano-7-deazaguanine synthase in queuosine biosynthesis
MTAVQVRTAPAQADAGADLLLDWFGPTSASTVRYEPRFLKGLAPTPVARDLLRLGGAVYCTDKLVRRAAASDHWTRRLSLQVPVSDPILWDAAKPELVSALCFLSGDCWELDFVGDTEEPSEGEALGRDHRVSLFSGGLDSLAGAIDQLETGRTLVLVGHHDSGLTDKKQKLLAAALKDHYGKDRVELRRLYLRPGAQRKGPSRPLPTSLENTTRSRSFLFFAAGVAVADALGETVPVTVPENGFIGINVPLTAARAGSLSTRTTHPHYMQRMSNVLAQLGLRHAIENPYRLMTKGEELENTANRAFLLELAPETISCSHPEAPRWAKRAQGNCGYCYPCLIRRASLHRVGADNDAYAWDALHESELLEPRSARGRSLRALTASLGRTERVEDVLMNGRIPNGETTKFFDVYRRGRDELRDWLRGAGPALRRRLGD